MSDEKENSVDVSALQAFDLTPSWAKGAPQVSVGRVHREERPAPRSGGDRDRRPRPGKPPFAKPFAPRPPRPPRPAFVKPMACEIKILPETKALGTIIRKVQGDTHAYKLKDLAFFFLDNPESILLKITPPAEETFFQCSACGFASTRKEDVLNHILSSHFLSYYEAKEVSCEPPKGTFSCVARCSLTGVLLGPPNSHDFNDIVRERVRTCFPNMTEDAYRATLETVRDPEAIEAWRQSAVKKTLFAPRAPAPEGGETPLLTRLEAESEFKRTLLNSLVQEPKNLMMTAAAALQSPVKPLVLAVERALADARRIPSAMCYALRGAFHHRKLHFFRANDSHGPEFVVSTELKAFDAAHAIEELAFAARFLEANPCLDKSEFPADKPDFEKHLQWLVSTGHAVAFTNGVFSAAEKYPKYGPQWKKREVEKLKSGKVEKCEGGEVEKCDGGEVEKLKGGKVERCEDAPQESTCEFQQSEVEEAKKDETTPVVAE